MGISNLLKKSLLSPILPKYSLLEQAVEWAVRSGQVRQVESARVSVPGQVRDVTGSVHLYC